MATQYQAGRYFIKFKDGRTIEIQLAQYQVKTLHRLMGELQIEELELLEERSVRNL